MARTESRPRIEAATCEEAVEKSIAGLTRRQLQEAEPGADYTARDVDVDPTDDEGYYGSTDSTDAERAANSGNSYFAVREDEEEGWRLMVPFCTGR